MAPSRGDGAGSAVRRLVITVRAGDQGVCLPSSLGIGRTQLPPAREDEAVSKAGAEAGMALGDRDLFADHGVLTGGHGWHYGLPRVFRTGNLRLIHAATRVFRYSSRTSCGVR